MSMKSLKAIGADSNVRGEYLGKAVPTKNGHWRCVVWGPCATRPVHETTCATRDIAKRWLHKHCGHRVRLVAVRWP
jgi:hypothetical protein